MQRVTYLFTTIILFSTQLNAADFKVKQGLWTANVTITGLPVPLPMHTFTYCVDKSGAIPQEKQMEGCKINIKHQSNNLNWTMTCENGGKGSGRATYQWDTMQAQVELTLPEGNMTLTSDMTGKWTATACSSQPH